MFRSTDRDYSLDDRNRKRRRNNKVSKRARKGNDNLHKRTFSPTQIVISQFRLGRLIKAS